jgi:hypothetical protein
MGMFLIQSSSLEVPTTKMWTSRITNIAVLNQKRAPPCTTAQWCFVATVTGFSRNGNKLLSNQDLGLNLKFILWLSTIQYYRKQHTSNSQRNYTFPSIQVRQEHTACCDSLLRDCRGIAQVFVSLVLGTDSLLTQNFINDFCKKATEIYQFYMNCWTSPLSAFKHAFWHVHEFCDTFRSSEVDNSTHHNTNLHRAMA